MMTEPRRVGPFSAFRALLLLLTSALACAVCLGVFARAVVWAWSLGWSVWQ